MDEQNEVAVQKTLTFVDWQELAHKFNSYSVPYSDDACYLNPCEDEHGDLVFRATDEFAGTTVRYLQPAEVPIVLRLVEEEGFDPLSAVQYIGYGKKGYS